MAAINRRCLHAELNSRIHSRMYYIVAHICAEPRRVTAGRVTAGNTACRTQRMNVGDKREVVNKAIST